MTDHDVIQEYANLMILFMNRLDTLEDVLAEIDTRLERIEKVMD